MLCFSGAVDQQLDKFEDKMWCLITVYHNYCASSSRDCYINSEDRNTSFYIFDFFLTNRPRANVVHETGIPLP